MQRQLTRRWRRRAAVTLALAALPFLAEAGLRLQLSPAGFPIGFDSEPIFDSGRWVRSPYPPFAGKPGARVGSLVNNSYGFATPELPAVKEPQDYFVVALGESTATSESGTRAWPELLQDRLREHSPGKNIVVFNLGSELATSTLSVTNLSLIGTHLLPDLVVTLHGCNELSALGAEDFEPDHSHLYRALKPAEFAPAWTADLPRWVFHSYLLSYLLGVDAHVDSVDELRAFVWKHPQRGKDPLVGMASTLRNFVTLAAIAEGRGGRALFATYPFGQPPRAGDDEFNQRLRELFEHRELPFVDQDQLFASDQRTVERECQLAAAGQAALAAHFAERIIGDHLIENTPLRAQAIATEFRTSLPKPTRK